MPPRNHLLSKFLVLLSISHQMVDSFLVSANPEDIKFFLFPRAGNKTEIVCNNSTTLKNSSYLWGHPTVIIVHGYTDSNDDPLLTAMKDAYLATRPYINVIMVDWSKLSTPPIIPTPLTTLPGYVEVVLKIVDIVGERIACFIIWLNNEMVLEFNDVHIIGHSIGAHVAGETGKRVQYLMDGEKIGRLTGLDPAGPLFFPSAHGKSLARGDGHFVDVIHTNIGILGGKWAIGDADFIVNGGTFQPKCEIGDVIFLPIGFPGACSHMFANRIYTATLYKNFMACSCQVIGNLLKDRYCDPRCNNPVLVGADVSPWARGVFHIAGVQNPPLPQVL